MSSKGGLFWAGGFCSDSSERGGVKFVMTRASFVIVG